MCGIAGFLESSLTSSPEELRHVVLRMADTLRHRGPDDGGAWVDAAAGIALSMRRLAILDLSPTGRQPMQSSSGRYFLVFNGEIYNCEDLRGDLLAQNPRQSFRGHSDTEVMLAAFEHWGVLDSVRRFNGMFAFALWDRCDRTLTLARDRFGEKPLYYCVTRGQFLFASELKALRAHPQFAGEIDVDSVALYLRHNCIPAPYSIYRNTRKLLPGSVLTVSSADLEGTTQQYWSLSEVAEAGTANPLQCSEEDAIEMLDGLLREAVKIRMYSDVPLGAFLSGGIDSSTVVALMQSQSSLPVKTFSIGSPNEKYDEAAYAARVARHLRTDHTELYVTSREAMEVIPRLPQIYDEPFADCSQIPTFLVANLARQSVTVSLSGDGGDEIFGGYNRHTWGGALWQRLEPIPFLLRKLGAATINALSPDAWDMLYRTASPALPRTLRQRMPGDKLHKLAGVMGSRDAYAMYCRLASHWDQPTHIVNGSIEPHTLLTNGKHAKLATATEQMMYFDSVTYLPDDILVKLDRATMAVSLEARVPLLDHRVAEFAWTLPLPLRVRGREGKWILRQLLYRYVPREIIERPKSGFGIPIDSWLRGPLRDWAEGLLDEGRILREGLFNPKPIRQRWKEHLEGRHNWAYHLWDVLMFQAWLEEASRALETPSHAQIGTTCVEGSSP
jgi:asparagine synthase (glutamine-hydrolysing)